jgi:hypothetical protein
LFVLAIYPEQQAKLLTNQDDWILSVPDGYQTSLATFSDRIRFIRKSAKDSPGGILFRTWSPDGGMRPLELESKPFKPTEYMSIIVAGRDKTFQGGVQAHLVCEDTGKNKEIYSGSVGVNVVEAIVVTSPSWCVGDVRLKFSSIEENTLAGVGSVYSISCLSWFKSSFLGKLPYFFVALMIFGLLMLSGASLATHLTGTLLDPVPVAFISLGLGALVVFFLTSMMPLNLRWAGVVIVLISAITLLLCAGQNVCKVVLKTMWPYFKIWGLAGLIYLAIQGLVVNGLGHWEPNYRFWPAIWDSDNELPWVYAEGIRNGYDLKDLFGGAWLPTDRPPLMVGAYLLLTDIFRLLQSGNDGLYLIGQAYNFAAVALNSLWVPVIWWMLRKMLPEMRAREQMLVLIFIGSLPMVVFNTTYGWPKYFGTTFALVAAVIVLGKRDNFRLDRNVPLFFFLLAALSMLSHASIAFFLVPLGVLFLFRIHKHRLGEIILGVIAGGFLLASWSLYKYVVLPSSDVLVKYALTGDMGFINKSQPLLKLMEQRYEQLSMTQWLGIKGDMLLQSFVPSHQNLNNLDLNFDFGANTIDRLRAWDMFMLSKGNVGILFLTSIALLILIRAVLSKNRDDLNLMQPFFYLLLIGISSWILIVICFFIPIVIHHWPQGGLFALAIGGGTITAWYYPSIFKIITALTIIYTLIVWVFQPLISAISIDWGALLTMLVIIVIMIRMELSRKYHEFAMENST